MRLVRYSAALLCVAICGVLPNSGHAAIPFHLAQSRIPVRLCTSVPLGSPGLRRLATGINHAAILATEQWEARFRTARLTLLPPLLLDDARPIGAVTDREEQDAHQCASRSDTLGYVGPLNSYTAPYSMPVLNRAGMVQMSPGNTLPTLTSPVTRKALEPATYSHALAYPTYYRMTTTDAMQGPSAVAYLQARLHARTYFLIDDRSQYGAGVTGAMKSYASKIGLELAGTAHLETRSRSTFISSASDVAAVVAARRPDGVLYAANSLSFFGSPKSLFRSLRQAGYTGPAVGTDTVIVPRPSDFTSVGEKDVFATNPAPSPQASSPSFQHAYSNRFHTPLQQYDALAYDAANIILNAIYQAAVHGMLHGGLRERRVAVLPYVAHVRWQGATGITSFDANGDTTNRIVNMYRVWKGAWRFIGTAPPVKGVSPAG